MHRHRTLQPPQHSLQSEEMRGVVHMKLLGAAGVATNPWGRRAPREPLCTPSVSAAVTSRGLSGQREPRQPAHGGAGVRQCRWG